MKKYQLWAIADTARLGVASLAGILVYWKSATIVPMEFAVVIGVIAFILLDHLLGKWYYSGVSNEEKMFHGGDDL